MCTYFALCCNIRMAVSVSSTPHVAQRYVLLLLEQQQQRTDAHTHTQDVHTDTLTWLLPPHAHALLNCNERNSKGKHQRGRDELRRKT
mgnify:CR=1 FL=1